MAICPGATRRSFAGSPLRINHGHPLARHLIAAWVFGDGGGAVRDVISGRPLVRALGTVPRSATPAGLAFDESVQEASADLRLQRPDRVSLYWYGLLNATPDLSNPPVAVLYHNISNGAPFHCYGIYRPNGTDIVFSYNNAGTFGNLTAASLVTTAEYSRPLSLACSYGTDAVQGYKDGRLVASGGGIAGITYGGSSRFYLGYNPGGTTFSHTLAVLTLIFGTVLTPTDHALLAANPYALFVKPGVPFVAAAVAAAARARADTFVVLPV